MVSEEVAEAFLHASEANNLALLGITMEPPVLMNWELKKPPALAPGANLTKLSDVGERRIAAWRKSGIDLYFKGRVAIVILSGGLDSSMGETIPKGALDIGLLSHKSIFQLYIERIRRLQHLVHRKCRTAVYIPIYVMCNKHNREIIEDFFHENEFFGIREQDVLFFAQGSSPICSLRGKFLLKEKHRIASEPNGNGGMFRALVEEGMISDMKSRGVTSLYISSIDNVLAAIGDPVFIGYCEGCKAEVGLKCVQRLVPEEKYGIFCSKRYKKKYEDTDGDGKVEAVSKVKGAVVEFYEVPDEVKKRRTKRDSQAPLEFSSGNLSQYFFKVDFVKKAHSNLSKRWHMIPKAMSYIDTTYGERVELPPPGEHNAVRLEMFVFDSFEQTRSVVGMEVGRTEYAPVKNISGPESPQTALQAMGQLHQQWILDAGGKFADTKVATEREDLKCEISPLVSYSGEDLAGHFPQQVALPFYLPSMQELTQFSAASSMQTRRPSTHYLDWYSDLAQRELEVELQGQLKGVMEMIEDNSILEYPGERAEDDDEKLPPTPRQAGQRSFRGPAAAQSAQSGQISTRKAYYSEEAAMSGDLSLTDAKKKREGEEQERKKPSDAVRKSVKKKVRDGGRLEEAQAGTGARDAFWGDQEEEEEEQKGDAGA